MGGELLRDERKEDVEGREKEKTEKEGKMMNVLKEAKNKIK